MEQEAFGTQTAALVIWWSTVLQHQVQSTESYNGTSWTEIV
jgi:hypothetical protein